MKRTDRLTKIISAIIFLTFLAYGAVYLARSMGGQLVTAEAVATTVSFGGTASGIIVREELVLESDELYIDVTAAEGAKVGGGQAVATAMSGETGLARATRIHELESEIARVSAALEGPAPGSPAERDAGAAPLVKRLTAAVARHEMDELDAVTGSLRAMIFSSSGADYTPEYLASLQTELDGLTGSRSSDTTVLSAPVPGVFSTAVDGYEALTPDMLDGLTPSVLNELISSPAEPPETAYGKLVTGTHWYFAAVMSEIDAENLRRGSYAALDFGRYYGEDVYAEVTQISARENGEVAVVFRCGEALAELLPVRRVSAEVVFDSYSGVRVPSSAIHADADSGKSFVYVITAMQIERKNVNIIYAGDGFCIVARESRPDALREGNTIVVSGDDIYEGKILE